MKDHELTAQETLALNHTAALWNALVQLPSEHPDEINEMRTHIHAIQNSIAARPAWRILNGGKRAPATKTLITKPDPDGK